MKRRLDQLQLKGTIESRKMKPDIYGAGNYQVVDLHNLNESNDETLRTASYCTVLFNPLDLCIFT